LLIAPATKDRSVFGKAIRQRRWGPACAGPDRRPAADAVAARCLDCVIPRTARNGFFFRRRKAVVSAREAY